MPVLIIFTFHCFFAELIPVIRGEICSCIQYDIFELVRTIVTSIYHCFRFNGFEYYAAL